MIPGIASEDGKTNLARTPLAPLPMSLLENLLGRPQARTTQVPGAEQPLVDQGSPAEIQNIVASILDSAPAIEWPTTSDTLEEPEYELQEALPNLSSLAIALLDADVEVQEQTLAKGPEKAVRKPSYDYKTSHENTEKIRKRAKRLYDQRAQAFTKEKTPQSLTALLRVLGKVDCRDIDETQADIVVQEALLFLNGDENIALAACEIVLQYRLKLPSSLRLNISDITLSAVKAFKSVVVDHMPETPAILARLEKVILRWIELIKTRALNEQQVIVLLTSAWKIIFAPTQKSTKSLDMFEKTRRVMANLVVECYAAFPTTRSDIVADILANFASLPPKNNRHYPISPLPGSGSIQVIVAIVLNLIQVAGQAPLKTWEQAVAYRNRTVLEQACKSHTSEAVALCNTIAQYLVNGCKSNAKSSEVRLLTTAFIEDVAQVLQYAEWPGAEMLLSCIIGVLFHYSPTYLKQRQYPVFLFDILKSVQTCLFEVFSQQDASTDPDCVGTVLDALVNEHRADAALYLATKLTLAPNAPFQEYYARLTCSVVPSVRTSLVPKTRWYQLLKRWPIGQYYEQILEIMLATAENGAIPDKNLVEILKVLAQSVSVQPSIFTRIHSRLMLRLHDASASVCDAIVQVGVYYIVATSIEGNIDLVDELCQRMASPGITSYKRRCIRLLLERYSQTASLELQALCWQNLLRATVDPERTVADLASQGLEKIVYKSSDSEEERLGILAKIILKVHQTQSPYPYLLRRFLRMMLIAPPNGVRRRVVIRSLVAQLLVSVGSEMPLEYDALAAAAVILEANGLYVPTNKMAGLFSIAVSRKQQPPHRLVALRMLHHALAARPRMILSPKLVTQMFPSVLAMLQVYREPEIEHAAPLLWQLATVGGSSDKASRMKALKMLLQTVTKFSDDRLKQTDPDKSRETMVQARQLLVIQAAAVRFWRPDEGTNEFAVSVLKRLIKVIQTTKRTSELRLVAVRALIKICTTHPVFFVSECRLVIDHDILAGDMHEPEWNEFMAQLLEFLIKEEEASDVRHARAQAGYSISSKAMTSDKLHGMGEDTAAESAGAGLIQKYLSAILERATAGQDYYAATATRLLAQSIDAGRVDVHACVPTVIALTTSCDSEIAKVSQVCFAKMHSRWGSVVTNRLPEGLKAAARYHRRLGSNSGLVDYIPRLWEHMKASQGSLKSVVERLVETLPRADAAYAVLIVSGFSLVRLDRKDAERLSRALEKICISFDYDKRSHSAEDVAVRILFYGFYLYLKERYGLDLEESALGHPWIIEAQRVIDTYGNNKRDACLAFESVMDMEAYDDEDLPVILYGSTKRRKLD